MQIGSTQPAARPYTAGVKAEAAPSLSHYLATQACELDKGFIIKRQETPLDRWGSDTNSDWSRQGLTTIL